MNDGVLWTLVLVVMLAVTGGFLTLRFLRQRAEDRPFLMDRFAQSQDRTDLDGRGFGSVAPFALTDQTARAFDSDSLRSKVWIADFIFTRCGGPCPRMSAEIERIREDLKGEKDLAFVSFSVDPTRDSPQVLDDYAKAYGGARDNWHLLTGPVATIAALSRTTFKVGLETTDAPDDIRHSTFFFLVDRKGVIRGRYAVDAPEELAALRKDARTLLARKDNN